MEELLNPTSEVETSTEIAEQAPATPEERLSDLTQKRMGQFELMISYADLKYIKNTLNSKIEWKGPNEAYLIVMTLLTLDQALESMDPKKVGSIKVSLPSSTIESINLFLNRITGKGIESAQKIFSIFMQLRQTLEAIKKIDQEIDHLQNEISIKTEKNS